ncbi:MAG: DUF362 domain-containing protein [Planctomycetes bacterium]|nr:DUF362 domain-containing protein [Planctomycetota bacterium]
MNASMLRSCPAARFGAAIGLAIILLGAGPPDRHHPDGDTRPADCPGRHASGHDPHTAAPVPPPPLERFRAGPYGYVWGFAHWPLRAGSRHAPDASESYRAQVFHVEECATDPVGDRFVGLDALVMAMGREGLKLYQSATTSIDSGPDGIIASDDVVIIKINYQWPQRGGTNVDVLRGLVRRLVDHPDGFTGEIVVCENAQFMYGHEFDRGESNAQDTSDSPHAVVVEFQPLGFDISHYAWGDIRQVEVGEYGQGDLDDGYVLLPYDPQLVGRVSYPKFRTGPGTYISLRYGVWSTTGEGYDREKLKFINLPVLKSHHAVYGATACVKNYMGVVTNSLGTGSHGATAHGILGALMGIIRPADLNILDCIWVNGNPYSGPSTTYAGATLRNELVASTDPVAADRWAVTNILIPAFIDNGYNPPWPLPSADPDDPTSPFRFYLDNSMDEILAAGYDVTNHPPRIDTFTWSGAGDLDDDGEPDASDNCPFDANPDQADCDDDGLGDVCAILSGHSTDFNANGIPDECECLGDLDGDGAVGFGDILDVIAAWGPCTGCPEDLDGSGDVGFSDVLVLIGAWGPCG